MRFARLLVLPLRRKGEEEFSGDGGPRLIAGNALHADVTPDADGQRLFGWVLSGLGQQHGFPVPGGGAGSSPRRSSRRLEAAGGRVVCGSALTEIRRAARRPRGGRAHGRGERQMHVER